MSELSRCQRLSRILAMFGIALFAATWQLWTPQSVFPQIPFISWGVSCPAWIDWLSLAAIGGALCVQLLGRQRPAHSPATLLVFILAAVISISADQHRLQPWTYHLVLTAILLATLPAKVALTWLRVLTISIYIYSAISKLDASFVQTHGQQLVEALLHNFGLTTETYPDNVKTVLAGLLPAGELAVAAGLSLQWSRRPALWASIVMHVLLMLAVGPWGLNHKIGVLIWNAYFIVQNVLVFGPLWQRSRAEARQKATTPQAEQQSTEHELAQQQPSEQEPAQQHPNAGTAQSPTTTSPTTRVPTWYRRLGIATVMCSILFPLLEPWNLFDHWPGWALYSSRSERVIVWVHQSQLSRLEPPMSAFVSQRAFESPWCRVDLDRWSLATLDVPIYPQGRFRLAVASALSQQYELQDNIRIVIQSPADRWTGARTAVELIGTNALKRATEGYWLNTRHRGNQ